MGNNHSSQTKDSKQNKQYINFQNKKNNQDPEIELQQGLLSKTVDKNYQKNYKVLIQHIANEYPQLTQFERNHFCSNHPWLVQELFDNYSQYDEDDFLDQQQQNQDQDQQQQSQNLKDSVKLSTESQQIIRDALKIYLQGKLERVKQIVQMVHDPEIYKKQLQIESEQKNLQGLQGIQSNQNKNQHKQIKYEDLPKEYRFIEQIDELMHDLQNNKQGQNEEIYLQFYMDIFSKIINNPQNPEFRIVKINKFQFKFWKKIKETLKIIDFIEVQSENEDDFCQMMYDQEKIEDLQKYYKYLNQSYESQLKKYQFKNVNIQRVNLQQFNNQNKQLLSELQKENNQNVNKKIQSQANLPPILQDNADQNVPELLNMNEKEKRVYYMKQAQQIRQQQTLTNEQMQFYQQQSQEFEKFGLKMAKKPQERIITMEKIEFDRIQEDQKALELLAWELSNKFRQENGLNPVKWSEGISQVCFKHSVNMGNKIVPFGHDGFNDRFIELQKISIVKSACENVAYSNKYINLAESIVKGWINSPGHRKNLLSHSNYMGIGVYRNSSGYWYFTQIFALMI